MEGRCSGWTACRLFVGRRSQPAPHLGIVFAAWDPIATATSVNVILDRFATRKEINWSMVVVANNGAVRTWLMAMATTR